jgi:hypothetical protein
LNRGKKQPHGVASSGNAQAGSRTDASLLPPFYIPEVDLPLATEEPRVQTNICGKYDKGGEMRRLVVTLSVAAIAAVGTLAGTALASGPAPPGKELVKLNCTGLGPVTVSVQRGQNSKGAGQIVGMKGHGIPVKIVFTITDMTTSTVIDSETQLSGHGHGHRHQATTECTGTIFQGAASDFFGTHLPPGVSATDTVQASIDAFVIIKR